MLTKKQSKWIAHLSDDPVKIIPYSKNKVVKFQKQKNKLKRIIGADAEIVERGSTRLKIAGKDEIDIYIPVRKNEMDKFVLKLEKVYGKPRSRYPDRTRFGAKESGTRIEVFIVNVDSYDYKNIERFENFLLKSPDKLKEFEKFKKNWMARARENTMRKR